MKHKKTIRRSGLTIALAASIAPQAFAQTDPAAAPAAYWDTFSLGAELEAGITANPNNGYGGNFGQLFTDKEKQPLLNQLSLTAAWPTDPKATDWDWGFKLQGFYGTDARYTHFLGEFTHATPDRAQFDIEEASITTHVPLLAANGIDVKFGQYPTPIGFEVIEPSLNPFYSHSYIFNFGIPLKHTGGYITAHLSDTFDLWLGGDTGVNTSFDTGDNNDRPAFIGGFALNGLMDGKLSVLALTHIGPENAKSIAPIVNFNPNSELRYLNDAVITYKATDALTFTTEANYIRDDGFHAEAWGVSQYLSYAVNDNITLNGRAEVFRDNNGFFVFAFPGNDDFVKGEQFEGFPVPNGSYNYGKATYGELTFGVTYKPDVPDAFKGAMIRPELRVDDDLDGPNTYNKGKDDAQFTAAIDVVIPFAIVSPPTPETAPAAPPPVAAPAAAPAAMAPESQRSFQVFFDFNKSDITMAAAKVIQAAADTVKAGGTAKITVTGHTDTVGSVAYNQKLSERRAASVKMKLVADGVSGGEITTIGVGKTGLLVPTADGVREPQNRRAEIVLQ